MCVCVNRCNTEPGVNNSNIPVIGIHSLRVILAATNVDRKMPEASQVDLVF